MTLWEGCRRVGGGLAPSRPSQNRAGAINAHGSSPHHLSSPIPFPFDFSAGEWMFPCRGRCGVTSFPLQALPCFFGTTRQSDSLLPFAYLTLYRLFGILSAW